MVTDALWTDYDKDGKADLVLAGEYMPVRVFHNENKILKEVTAGAGLSKTNGWWNRLQAADVNNDGYMDIIAANHGLNSLFKAREDKPVELYAGEFGTNGTVQPIITCYNGDSSYPMLLRHDLVSVLPYLKKKYLKYEDYKQQTITDIFSQEQVSQSVHSSAYMMQSVVLVNNRHGGFDIKELPTAAQLSPMYGAAAVDADGDGNMDIVMGGNFYQSQPQVGIYDASYGVLLKGDGRGNFTSLPAEQSGINIRGAVRDIKLITVGKKKVMLVAKNNEPISFLNFSK